MLPVEERQHKRPRLELFTDMSFEDIFDPNDIATELEGELQGSLVGTGDGSGSLHDSGDSMCVDITGCEGSTIDTYNSQTFFDIADFDEVGSVGYSGVFDGEGSPRSDLGGLFFSQVVGTGPSGNVVLQDAVVDQPVQGNVVDELGEFGDDVPDTLSGNFRLQGKVFHLTYRGHIAPDEIFRLFGGAGKLQYYSIVHEHGVHGGAGEGYDHTHAYVHLHSRCDKRGPRCLDIGDVHPHIQKVASKVHEGRLFHIYHRKAAINIWQSVEAPPDPGLTRDRQRILDMLHRGSLLDAVIGFGAEIKSVADIKALREERKPAEPAESNFGKEAFTLHLDWGHTFAGRNFDTCCILLWGGAGLGKTECAISHFDRCLLVRSLDQARDFNEHRYDGIVFDDCSLVHLSAEERIHLADFSQPSVIKARYSNGYIPKNVKRIFTTNKTPAEYWRSGTNMTDEQYEGIKRRVKFIHVIFPTF